MEDTLVPTKILTYNTKRRKPQSAHSYGGGTNTLFKRTEQTKHGLIHEDDDDDDDDGL
jgi:hypothetical protein